MATNMYLKFENPSIGSSDAPGHHDEIEVVSWNHGVRPSAGDHQSLTFTKYLDRATNDLQNYTWSGKQIGKATLRCFRSDGSRDGKPVLYLTVTMQNVVISNYSVSGGPGDLPLEDVSLDYGKIQYEYLG